MEALKIAAKEDSPEIIFDPQNKLFEINHRSLPEDAVAFYAPAFNWLEKYRNEITEPAVFKIKLDYFNTTTAKQLYKMFCVLAEISEKHKISVQWLYQSEDKDMRASGERYSKLIDLDFEIIEY